MNVNRLAVLQKCNGALQVALVLVEATWLSCVLKPALQSQHELPPAQLTVNVLLNVIEKLDEAHFTRHERCVVVEGGSVEEGVFSVPGLEHMNTVKKVKNQAFRTRDSE